MLGESESLSSISANFEMAPEQKDSDSSVELSWVQWFCALQGHEYLLEVPTPFFEKAENLIGIESVIK